MNTRTLIIALVLAAMTLAACSPGHGGQTGSVSLEGTHWVLLTLSGRSPLAGTTITAEFLEDQITGHSGCNSYFGPYTVDGSALQFEEIGMTEMACLEPEDVMVQETTYAEVLRNVAGYRLAGDRLEMLGTSSEVVLVYERQEVLEADPADLVGTEWSLVMLDDSPLDEGMAITISFEEDQYRGLAGCRHFEGDYHANSGEIRFTSITMLEDECPGAGNEYYVQEGRFTDSLTWARHWGIVDGQLEVQTVRGGVLLFAQAPPMPEVTLEGTGWALTALPETTTHATPVSQQPAAGICGALEGDWVVVTIHPDMPDPRCARVAPHQKLSVVNRTSATLHVALGNLEGTIEPEGECAFDVPFGAYLAPGVHVVQVSPCCGPELWLEEPTTTVPTQAATPDIAATVMAIEPPRLYRSYPSPDGEWRAEVVVYECVRVGAVDEYAYEQLRLAQAGSGVEQIIASQLRYCGGLGAAGLDGLFWSPNSRYFYYTDAREGVPDGCGYWERPTIRVDTIRQNVEYLGGGPVSPDRSKLVTWVGQELVVWDVNGGETARIPATASDAGAGPIAVSVSRRGQKGEETGGKRSL